MFWVREAIRRGYFPGPRLQLAGRAITHSRGHIHWAGGVADTPDEIRRQVRMLVAEGADVHQGGRVRRRHQGRHPVPRLVHRRRAAGRRRGGARAGAPTVAHARATQSIENCIDAGIDAIAHVEFLRRAPSWTWAAPAPHRPTEARPAGGREAGGLAGLPRSEPAVERLGHAGAVQAEGRQRRGADRRRAGPAGQPRTPTSTTSSRSSARCARWGWSIGWASAATPARSTPSSATWSTASRSRGWPASRRWSRCRS